MAGPGVDHDFSIAVRAHLSGGRPGRAARLYKAVLRRSPEHVPALLNLGVLRFEAGRLEEAARLFQRAVEVAPDDPSARFNLGRTELARGDRNRARDEFEAGYRLMPGDPDLVEHLGRLYLDLDLPGSAEELARHAASRLGDHPAPGLVLARVSLVKGEFEDCEARLVGLLERWPDAHAALALAAEARFQRGDADRAVLAIRRALLCRPESTEYQKALSTYLEAGGRMGRSGDPDPGAALGTRGPGRPGAAGGEPWERLRVQLGLAERARRHLERGTPKAGVAELLALAGRYPAEPVLWQEVGRLYEAMGEDRRAANLYRRSLDLDPGNLETVLRLCRLERASGRSDRARSLLEGLAPEHAGVPEVAAAWGEILWAEGEGRRALASFEDCLRRLPDDLEALRGAARCLRAAGRGKQGVELLERAVRAHPRHAGVALELAEALDGEGQTEKAEGELEAALGRMPGNAGLRLGLARRLAAGRRVGAARRVYRELVGSGPPGGGLEARLGFLEGLLWVRGSRPAGRVLRSLGRPRPGGVPGAHLAFLEALLAIQDRDPVRFAPAWQRAFSEEGRPESWGDLASGALDGGDLEFLRKEVSRCERHFASDGSRRERLERFAARLRPMARMAAGGGAG